MKVTFFGTTTLLFDDGIDQILFDCHFTRPSLIQLGFKKIQTDTKLIDSILLDHPMNRLKAIFVSHSHHDHVMDVPYVANQYNCDVYGSMSALNVARGGNVKEKMLHEFECFKEVIIGDYHITVIPSLHSKAKWYNDDLGQTIDSPLVQPAKKKEYKEGGSFDFIIKHFQKTYVIRPSFNYIEGQLNGIKADVLFLGVGGLSKATPSELSTFFKETIDKVEAKIVIPIHWDNFFSRLDKPIKGMPVLFENTDKSLYEMIKYCEKKDISTLLQLPLTFIEFE